MPLDLPGFYFDVARNRYFPATSSSSRSIQLGAGVGRAQKEPLPIITINDDHNGPKKTLKYRNTKSKRNIKTTLGASDSRDAFQLRGLLFNICQNKTTN